jgi:hypothetical protein
MIVWPISGFTITAKNGRNMSLKLYFIFGVIIKTARFTGFDRALRGSLFLQA